MKTLRLRVDPGQIDSLECGHALDEAAAILRTGGTVALPTETVYGLGANALNPEAVAKIFAAKQRPGWDPLIVHVCDEAMLAGVVDRLPEAARLLMEAFWPGPLTLLLPRSSAVPDAVTVGRPLVGVRMPAHPVAMELIRRAGVPIAAPSANRFGHTSPTTAEHVLEDLDGRIDAVVDAGPTSFGLESTVLDPNPTPMIVYRPGAITLEQIQAVAGPAKYFEDTGALAVMPREAMPSPGVGLRHYAPKARLILVEPVASIGDFVGGCHRIVEEMRYATDMQAEELGWMLPSAMPEMHERMFEPLAGSLVDPPGREFVQFDWGRWTHPEELAQRLFAGLRYLDALGCTVIFCPVPSGEGTAVAIRDRLRKAASKNPVED